MSLRSGRDDEEWKQKMAEQNPTVGVPACTAEHELRRMASEETCPTVGVPAGMILGVPSLMRDRYSSAPSLTELTSSTFPV